MAHLAQEVLIEYIKENQEKLYRICPEEFICGAQPRNGRAGL